MIALLVLALFSFSYEDVVRTDLIVHGKIRWSKVDADNRIVVEIQGGEAKRLNPGWSPDPAPLTYDLERERELSKLLKSAHLPSPRSSASEAPDDRTLEVMVEDAKGNWKTAGIWSMSVKQWKKGHWSPVYGALEPLLDTKPDLFAPRPVRK